jgi:hypothetical protein
VLGHTVAHGFGLSAQPSPAGETAHGAVMGRTRQVRSQHGHHTRCTHGGTLAGGPVVLGQRSGLADEHREVYGEASGKISRTGAYPHARATVRQLQISAHRSSSALGGLR